MKVLPTIFDFCNEHILLSFGNMVITPARLFLFIWIGGIICIAFNTFRNYRTLYGVMRCLPNLLDTPDNGISTILTEICKTDPVPHPVKKVIRTKYVSTPCVMGFFSPVILLPDLEFTKEELYCILQHELSHRRHKDLIWMLVTEALYMINWWNPFISLLRTQITEISELHADKTACDGLSHMQRSLYMECLMKVARNQQCKSSMPAISLPFSDAAHGFLKCRFLRITDPKPNKPFIKFMLNGIAVLLLVLSTLFIFEPAWIPEGEGEIYFTISDESYLKKREDGTYEFYIDDEHFCGILQDNNLEEIEDLPVYPAE